MFRRAIFIASFALTSLASPVLAHAAEDLDPNVAARHNLMGLMSYNVGVLGGMAQGRMAYDADMAATAAGNLVHLARVDQQRMWAEGSEIGAMPGSSALPAIWETPDDFAARRAALLSAAEAMAEVAGTDLAAVQGAIGRLGGACSACHQSYRQRD